LSPKVRTVALLKRGRGETPAFPRIKFCKNRMPHNSALYIPQNVLNEKNIVEKS
jgi:hypothetical protein